MRPTQSRKGVKGGLRPFSSAPCRVKGQRPLWGLGQRPNSSTGDQYAKRAQQRCRQRSAPASNSARPQTRPRAALPPRFREELAFSCSFTRLTVIILPSDSFSTSACRSVVRPRLPSPRSPVGSRGIFSSPPNDKKSALDSCESRANRNPAATYPPGPCPAKYFQHWRA